MFGPVLLALALAAAGKPEVEVGLAVAVVPGPAWVYWVGNYRVPAAALGVDLALDVAPVLALRAEGLTQLRPPRVDIHVLVPHPESVPPPERNTAWMLLEWAPATGTAGSVPFDITLAAGAGAVWMDRAAALTPVDGPLRGVEVRPAGVLGAAVTPYWTPNLLTRLELRVPLYWTGERLRRPAIASLTVGWHFRSRSGSEPLPPPD